MPVELKFHSHDFEETVRQTLAIFDRPVFDTDAERLETLNCDFWFDEEDCQTLRAFCNLRVLDIEGGSWLLPAISSLSYLKELYLIGGDDESGVDFRYFQSLKELSTLMVSGGAYSGMNLCHLESLAELTNLTDLRLHEFGNVDLKPLENMPWLKRLFCGYANTVENVEVIRKLVHLESLELIDFELKDLCFVDVLPPEMEICLGGLTVKQPYDLKQLERFTKRDLYENTVAGVYVP